MTVMEAITGKRNNGRIEPTGPSRQQEILARLKQELDHPQDLDKHDRPRLPARQPTFLQRDPLPEAYPPRRLNPLAPEAAAFISQAYLAAVETMISNGLAAAENRVAEAEAGRAHAIAEATSAGDEWVAAAKAGLETAKLFAEQERARANDICHGIAAGHYRCQEANKDFAKAMDRYNGMPADSPVIGEADAEELRPDSSPNSAPDAAPAEKPAS